MNINKASLLFKESKMKLLMKGDLLCVGQKVKVCSKTVK